MQNLLYIQDIDQAAALFQPLRVQLLKQMVEPRSCNDMAEVVGESPQKVYYHVKILERAGLVEKTSEQRVRGIMQGFYQAKARAYWLSPHIVGRLGGRRRTQDQMSLGFLLSLAEELQTDVAALAQHPVGHLRQEREEVPSLGLSAQITLRDGNERAAFMQEVQSLFQALARKYGRQSPDPAVEADDHTFQLMLACYPKPAAAGGENV